MAFFTPNTDFLDTYNEKGNYVLIWRLSIILAAFFGLASFLNYGLDNYNAILYFISFLICVFSFIYINIKKNIKVIYWIFTLSATSVVTVSIHTLMTTLHYPDYIWGLCTVVFAFIGLGKRVGLIFLIFQICSLFYFFIFGINDHLNQLKPISLSLQVNLFLEMVIAFLAMTYLIYHYQAFHNYTEQKLIDSNSELTKKVEENKILLKEIHHRIKNNLQLIVSLLRMQKNESNSSIIETQFSEAINRVMSISLIHQKLYENDEIRNFDFENYVKELIDEVNKLQQGNLNVNCELIVDVQSVGLKTIVPMGLIINELLTNSYKYAFDSDSENNEISIYIHQCSPEKVCLYYEDNGKWKENSEPGFGLELVEILNTQLEGTKKFYDSKYEFKFKNLDFE